MSEELKDTENQDKRGSSTDYEAMYSDAHPNAEPNKQRAEYMAYAGNNDELNIVREREIARNAASQVGQPPSGPASYEYQANEAVRRAKESRFAANTKEKFAGEIYDQTKNL